MDTETNARLIEVFTAALALNSEERAAFLAEACAGNEALCRDVESLLAHAQPDGSFLGQPAVQRYAKELAAQINLNGKQLGHYLVLEEIGSGGMGQVYKARDQKLGREVAIKILPPEFTSEAERVRRFEQEARAASALNHPNIITIYEVGQHEALHYIVMEYVTGQTLRTHLQAGKLPHEEAVDIAAQVADALAAAHHAGIVHRDVKPENIMLRRADGKVKVLDFGIAKLAEERHGDTGMGRGGDGGRETSDFINSPTLPLSLSPTLPLSTAMGAIMGTVNYMSPEQARGEPLDGRADVFSLGQMLLEMVTGKGLFAGQKSEAVLQVLRSEQELLTAKGKLVGVPKALEQIIRKSLQRNAGERYQAAQEMLADLKQIQQRTATKWLRRAVVGGLSGVVLLLVALGLAAKYSINETWSEQILRDGHSDTVRRAVFSLDGKTLVSVSKDHQVIVWDFARREKLRTLTDHTAEVNSVAFAPDGRWFATGSSDKTVIVWDAEKLQKVKVLDAHRDKVMAVAFSPDGKLLATSSGSDTGASEDFRTIIWDVNGWQKLRELPEGRTYGNLLFSPDSRLLKTQDSQWDTATGNKVTTKDDALGLNWNEFSRDAKQLLAVGAGGVGLYQFARSGQLAGRKQIGNYTPHQDFVRAVAYSPDGKLAATGADNIVLWEAATMKIQGRFEFESSVWSVTFSPDGRWLVSGHGDGTILVWNIEQRRREFSFNAHADAVRTVAISPDGKRYASAGDDRSVIVWNTETGRKEAVLHKHDTRVIHLVFSPDGKWLASLDQTGRLIRWDIERQMNQWEAKVIAGTSCLAVSPDGRWLVTHQIMIDGNDGRELSRLGNPHNELESLEAAAFSSDGKLLAGVWGKEVLLLDPQTWRIIDRQTDGNSPLVAIQFSRDGTKLLTGSTDGTLLLWATKPLRKMGALGKHEGQITSIGFSRNSEIVASSSSDKTVKLWDVKARKLLREIGTHAAPVAAVAFTPDGKRLLTGEQDRSVRVYRQQRKLWGWEWTF